MAKKRKTRTKARKKRKSASVARAGRRTIDIGKAAALLAKRVEQLRNELKKLKRSLTKSRKKRR